MDRGLREILEKHTTQWDAARKYLTCFGCGSSFVSVAEWLDHIESLENKQSNTRGKHDAALIQKRDREWALVCAEHDIAALADSNGPIKLDSSALRASVREECADAAMEAFGHNETSLPHSDGCIACAVKQAILAVASEKAAPEDSK